MTPQQKVATYKGRPITELSREELEAAYTHIGTLYHEHLDQSIADHQFTAELARTERILRARRMT